jgi:hypothetical protein
MWFLSHCGLVKRRNELVQFRSTCSKKAKNAKMAARGRRDSWPLDAVKLSNKLTFFSVIIHLVIAGMEEPVRSLSAKMASFTRARVVMFAFVFVHRICVKKREVFG